MLFADTIGFKKWFRFSIFFAPVVVLCALILESLTYIPSLAYSLSVYFFGYFIYLPISFLIVLLTYLHRKKSQDKALGLSATRLLILKGILFLAAGILYTDAAFLKGKWFMNVSIYLCNFFAFSATRDLAGNASYCLLPYLTLDNMFQCAEIVGLAAVVVMFANSTGFRRWLIANLFLFPITALLIYTTASEPVLFGAPVGFENPINFFGFWLYLPVTFVIVALSYIPKKQSE
jgi:hypothetical protein